MNKLVSIKIWTANTGKGSPKGSGIDKTILTYGFGFSTWP